MNILRLKMLYDKTQVNNIEIIGYFICDIYCKVFIYFKN